MDIKSCGQNQQKLIYTAGPYRAPTESGVVAHIRNAERVAVQLWQAGFAVICPHKNTSLLGGLTDDSVWLTGDLTMLRRCDAVCTISGWTRSEGAQAEVTEAARCGIPVLHSVAQVVEWPDAVCGSSVLAEAQKLVDGDRNTTYGHPLDDFTRTAALWSPIVGVEVTAEQVGACMIAVKLSRECHRPGRDNRVDIAGYAECLQAVHDGRERQHDAGNERATCAGDRSDA